MKITQVCGALASTVALQWGCDDKQPPKARILRFNNLKIQSKLDVLVVKIVHMKLNTFTVLSRLMVPDSSNWMTSYWLDQTFSRHRKNIRTFKLLTALFFMMPTHYLKMEICDIKQIYLRSITKGWQPLKRWKVGNNILMTNNIVHLNDRNESLSSCKVQSTKYKKFLHKKATAMVDIGR